MAYKCSCEAVSRPDISIGRFIGGQYRLADQSIDTVQKTTGYKPHEYVSDELELKELSKDMCPWQSFKNPIWSEVIHFLKLKDIPGTTNINDNTPNIVYDAVLFYESCYGRVDSYVVNKEIEKREEEVRKMKAKRK